VSVALDQLAVCWLPGLQAYKQLCCKYLTKWTPSKLTSIFCSVSRHLVHLLLIEYSPLATVVCVLCTVTPCC